MQADKGSRIDIGELKAQMLKKIGPERFKRYFYSLSRFINQKLSKSEFDRFCYRVLGREVLPLHNQIIKSILKNACTAKVPPPVHEVGPTKPSVLIAEDGHGQVGFLIPNQSPSVPVWANGAVLPSPRKVRSGIRERKLRDRPSPLGLNGKGDSASNHSAATEDSGGKTVENGDLMVCDYQRPLQHLHGPAEQPENEEGLKIKKSDNGPGLTHSKDRINVPTMEDGDEVEQGGRLNFSTSPLLAPLGIPFCAASLGGTRKSIPALNTSSSAGCYDSGGLFDTETLRKRMEQIATSQGLGGVSLQCANMLNNMVDVYLKKLIRSCVELVGARSENNIRYPLPKQQIPGKLVNGLWPSNHLHMQSGAGTVEEQKNSRSISLLDFKVAMELNPQQLGEDWPLLLEKISMQAFEE